MAINYMHKTLINAHFNLSLSLSLHRLLWTTAIANGYQLLNMRAYLKSFIIWYASLAIFSLQLQQIFVIIIVDGADGCDVTNKLCPRSFFSLFMEKKIFLHYASFYYYDFHFFWIFFYFCRLYKIRVSLPTGTFLLHPLCDCTTCSCNFYFYFYSFFSSSFYQWWRRLLHTFIYMKMEQQRKKTQRRIYLSISKWFLYVDFYARQWLICIAFKINDKVAAHPYQKCGQNNFG